MCGMDRPIPAISRFTPRPMSARVIRRGNCGGAIKALLQRGNAHLVVVLDSKYVYKKIVERLPRWWPYGWRNSSREVGHNDL